VIVNHIPELAAALKDFEIPHALWPTKTHTIAWISISEALPPSKAVLASTKDAVRRVTDNADNREPPTTVNRRRAIPE
jgi:hypothetical protein